jgi:putative ABC transport system permease protein
VIFGAIIYKALMFLGRYYGYYIHLTPSDLKLLTGILVIISLIVAQTRAAASSADARKKAIRRNKERRNAIQEESNNA